MRRFDPRPREGSDMKTVLRRQRGIVSIHAPVKGATQALKNLGFAIGVSIHAPVKGATYAVNRN